MKKTSLLLIAILLVLTFTACTSTQSVTCGEGTIIKDGKCVSPEVVEDKEESKEYNCDTMVGEVFYEADFSELQSKLVDNEVGNEHNVNNFVVWGSSESGQVVGNTTVEDGVLILNSLTGTQLDYYYNTGLGYQFFDFETDTTYSLCAVVEGSNGQSITSELGIFYGHGQRDEFLLNGTQQQIIQDFKPTLSTNNNFGQYVLFTGNITGELKVHEIKITKID